MKKKNNIENDLRVPYAQAVYGRREIKAVEKVLLNPLHIVAGGAVSRFENEIARLFGKKYGNLWLAFKVLKDARRRDHGQKKYPGNQKRQIHSENCRRRLIW